MSKLFIMGKLEFFMTGIRVGVTVNQALRLYYAVLNVAPLCVSVQGSHQEVSGDRPS